MRSNKKPSARSGKTRVYFRLSEQSRALLAAGASILGVTHTEMLELLIEHGMRPTVEALLNSRQTEAAAMLAELVSRTIGG